MTKGNDGAILNALTELVKYTGDLGFIQQVRVEGTDKETSFSASDVDQTMVIEGKFTDAISEFVGEFGITKLGKLGQIASNPLYKSKAATHKLTKRKVAGASQDVIDAIEFIAEDGKNKIRFNLAGDSVTRKEYKGGSNWDIDTVITPSKLKEFINSAAYFTEDDVFQPRVENGELMIYFGQSGSTSSDSGAMQLADGIQGVFSENIFWAISKTINILKLAANNKDKGCTVRFLSKGAFQIELTTDTATVKYTQRAIRK